MVRRRQASGSAQMSSRGHAGYGLTRLACTRSSAVCQSPVSSTATRS